MQPAAAASVAASVRARTGGEQCIAGEQFARRSVECNSAVLQDNDAVRDLHHGIGIVATHDHRGAFPCELGEERTDGVATAAIERRERFIEQPGARRACQQCREQYTLRLTARQCTRSATRKLRHSGPLHRALDRRHDTLPRPAEVHRPDGHFIAHRLRHATQLQGGRRSEIGNAVDEWMARRGITLVAGHDAAAFTTGDARCQSRQGEQQRAGAAAKGAGEPGDAAGRDVEIDAVERERRLRGIAEGEFAS